MTLGSVRAQVSCLIPHLCTPAITHTRELAAFGSGSTFSTTRNSIVQSLLDLALAIAGGTRSTRTRSRTTSDGGDYDSDDEY